MTRDAERAFRPRSLTRNLLLTSLLGLLIVVSLTGCSPRAYMRPVSEFKDAVETSRDVYFEQLKATKRSEVGLFTLQRRLARSWRKGAPGMTQEMADEIAKRESELVINAESFRIRERAFEIVIFYSGTLLALADGQDTEQLVGEIQSLKSDTVKLLERLDQLKEASDTLGSLGDLGRFAGPFSTAVAALEQIAEIVSGALREKAIRKSVVRADPMVQELFRTLGDEAYIAQTDARENYQRMLSSLNAVIEQDHFADNAARDQVFAVYVDVKARTTKLEELGERGDLRGLFEKARAGHSELVQQASGVNLEDLSARVREFRERALLLKKAFEEIGA